MSDIRTYCQFTVRKSLFPLFLLLLFLLSAGSLSAQHVYEISVCDLSPNYGIDCELITDSNALYRKLDKLATSRSQVEMECDNLTMRIKNMRRSLSNDYELRDNKLWIDKDVYVTDFDKFDSMLLVLLENTAKARENYVVRAEQREAVMETVRNQRVKREQQRQQADLDQQANSLKDSISMMHNNIFVTCNNKANMSKRLIKERKDIFYAYLSIYNKQDLNVSNATREDIVRLRDLLRMQRNMLDSVVGSNGYPIRIESFPNRLRDLCGRKHTEVYRNYLKTFQQPSVSVNFTNILEYYRYTKLLQNIVRVQEGYMKTIALRDTIFSQKDSIFNAYKNKYRTVEKVYEDCATSLNLAPSFSNVDDMEAFLKGLRDHIKLQRAYLTNRTILDRLERNAEKVNYNCGNLKDVRKAFSMITMPYEVLPNFCDVSNSAPYDSTLSRIGQMQDIYSEIIALRKLIDTNEQRILSGKHTERVFIRGYKTIKNQNALEPTCVSVPDGKRFVASLKSFAELQKKCIVTVAQSDMMEENSQRIGAYEKMFPNIYAAYRHLVKSMQKAEITNTTELKSYQMYVTSLLRIQKRFIEILNSDENRIVDAYLKEEEDVNHIKLLLKLDD